MSSKHSPMRGCSAQNGFCRWGGSLALIGVIALAGLALVWPGQAADVASDDSTAAATASKTPVETAEPVWHDNFDTALAAARSAKKPLLLRFTASWCVPCQVMDAAAWPDEEVQALLAENVVAMEVDVDRKANRELLRRYRVTGVPTLLLVDPQGEEMARSGFQHAEALRTFLRET